MTETADWSDLETQLRETRELLEEVEQRFRQVRRDLDEQQELQQRLENMRSQVQDSQITETSGDSLRINKNQKIRRKPDPINARSPINGHKEELQQQIQELSDRLEEIETDLESRLLSWSSFREPFWQIVRFVGIGIIIGVILKSCAG